MPAPHDAPAPDPAAAPAATVPASPPATAQTTPAPKAPDEKVSPTLRWVTELGAKARSFTAARHLRASAVKVTLSDGEWFYVDSVEPGPGEGFVSFSAYPPPAEMADQMVPVQVDVEGAAEPRTAYMTPRIVIVRVDGVRKIELLSEPPRDHPVGFTVRTDLVRASATPGP